MSASRQQINVLPLCQHKLIQLKQITLQPSHISLRQEPALVFACVDCGELLGIDRTSEIKRSLNRRFDDLQRGQADIRQELKRLVALLSDKQKQ